jgi:signal transduction histidine kinase
LSFAVPTSTEDGVGALVAELAHRAAAIAHWLTRERQPLSLPDDVLRRIDAAERRAIALARAGGDSEESARAAALGFVADATAVLTLDGHLAAGEAGELATETAAAIGIARGAAKLVVFQRALGTPRTAQLPLSLACAFVLDLIVELGPAEGVSLWTRLGPTRLECVAAAGEAATSRRLRSAARALLDGEAARSNGHATHVRSFSVSRWDGSHAALVARARPEVTARLDAYLSEAAAALTPFFERERLYDHGADRERTLVSAAERRLTRLGCDLHDGPLQELAALAADLRFARDQIGSLLSDADSRRVRGRFDDLEARLAALDQGLRDISQGVRSTSALESPLEDALRTEVEAFSRRGSVHAGLSVDGDLTGLSASQRIVLFRVVQESLSNAGRHSGARSVRVRARSTPRYVSVAVSDDGCGFDVATARRSGRLGLTGVTERVRLLGGDIEIRSIPGRGTRVRATLPRWARVTEQSAPIYAVT